MTERDAKIIKDSEEQGIPIFVLTAKDKLSLEAIIYYCDMCEFILETSNINTEPNEADLFIDNLGTRIEEFKAWQLANPSKVKLPD